MIYINLLMQASSDSLPLLVESFLFILVLSSIQYNVL